MVSHPDRYYRSAGAVPFMGILLMTGAGFAAAAVCGFLYAAADWYIAYDIVPFLCAPFAGAGIGGAVRLGAMAGRVRNRAFLALVGLAMGTVGVYFAWVFFIRIWDQAGFWLWDPLGLVLAINAISEVGVWENQPTGIWLKLIYGIEALAFMVPAAGVAAMEMKPFCDHCNAWTKPATPTAVLQLTDPDVLRERLEESQYEALDELLDPQVNRLNCLNANALKCPHCDESNYLTVSHVTIVQKGNEEHRNEKTLINNLWVPVEVVDQVRQLADGLNLAGTATGSDAASGGNADVAAAFGARPSDLDATT